MNSNSMTDLSWDNMISGIYSQTNEIRESPSKIYSQINILLNKIQIPSKIYLVGCGDSWVSGLCAMFAFETWTGIPVETVQALEFSAYKRQHAPENALLVAISISGKVSSTIDAVKCAKSKGMITIGGTTNLHSEFAKLVDYVVEFDYSEKRFGPGTVSFIYSLLFLYCLALFFAVQNKQLNQTQLSNWLIKLSGISANVEKTIAFNQPFLKSYGEETALDKTPIFIGAGPNYGTAIYGMIKVIETARIPARSQQLEEWAHQDYFLTDNNTITIVITPEDDNIIRVREQIWAANQLGSTTIAICSENDGITQNTSTYSIPVFGSPDLLLSPLVYCIPVQLFAYYLAVQKDLTMLGYDDPKIKKINQRQIYLKE